MTAVMCNGDMYTTLLQPVPAGGANETPKTPVKYMYVSICIPPTEAQKNQLIEPIYIHIYTNNTK